MECGHCPLALPCFARRLFQGNSHGMLCPKCGRFTHVQFKVYQAEHTTPGGQVLTLLISAQNLGISEKVRELLEQYHTVLHCPKRRLKAEQLEAYDRLTKNNTVFIPPTVPDPVEGFERIQEETKLRMVSDVFLNIVPCGVCDRARYSKGALIECLD